jgi:glucosamine-6-phosphate deaminase
LPGQALLATQPSLKGFLARVSQSIQDKIEQGLVSVENKAILHTAPHHDDVMLSYYPLMNQLLHNNDNTFAYLTSGFNSVTDQYLIDAINSLGPISPEDIEQDVIKKSYPALLTDFSGAYHRQDNEKLEKLESMFVFHKFKEAFWLKNYASFKRKADQIKEILSAKTPGDKDIAPIQLIKGMIRESEADRLWAINSVDHRRIKHLRSKFYTGAIFDPIPNIQDDAKPVMKLYERTNPDIITVALDPEGTGPDTHYKVLQVVSQALKLSPSTKAEVWGYRNVWHRFDYQDANMFVPVQYKQLLEQDASFLNAFATQKTAAFPSPAYDGSFSDLSAKIQKSQIEDLKILLGDAYFETHDNALIRNATGFVLIKRMPRESFVVFADDLKSKMQLDMKMTG